MENLGEFLRQEREQKKVPIEEMAIRTRIAIRFIKAIEENQFDQLPNQVSAKGFLRSYARCLGLDEEIVLKGFSDAVHPSEPHPPEEVKEDIPSYIQMKRPDRLPFPLWAALAVGGVIIVLLALTFFMPKRQEAPVAPPAAEVVPPPADPVPPEPAVPGAELPPGESGGAPAPSVPAPATSVPPASTPKLSASNSRSAPPPPAVPLPAVPSEPQVKSMVLLVEATEASWIQVNIDGTETKEALLQPNQKVKWEAKQKFILTVGNAGGVRVNLDGKDLGPFGPSGKVVKKELTAPAVPPPQ
jgi:cytoskeletal protein RodZ